MFINQKNCNGCKLKPVCTKSKKGRIIHRYKNQKWREAYIDRMQSETGLQKIKERKSLVEHPFGTIKCLMGKNPFAFKREEKM